MAFKHPGKIAAPFNIMSSSAKGGYLKRLHGNFIGSVEINNFHEDICQDTHDTVPLQGPFTWQWVGGRQHRHQDIVTGSIHGSKRAESIKVIPDTNRLLVYGADHPSLHQARAVLYRDGVAKRPLNIANIQYGTGSQSIGNYQHNYQIVQTTGRATNPRDFAEDSTSYQAHPERMTHEGDALNSLNDIGSLRNFTLKERKQHKSVIANKFSAPGDRYTMSRGFLDQAGEEMSVYNAMPFRNLPNRTTLRNQLTRHMKFGGYESGSNTVASAHKVYRNSNKTPNKTSFDNYFIQRPIPQTDLQYAWITESLSSLSATASARYGYQQDSEALSLHTFSPRYLETPFQETPTQYEGILPDNYSKVIDHDELIANSSTYARRAYMDVIYSGNNRKYYMGISAYETGSIEFLESNNGVKWTQVAVVSGAYFAYKTDMQLIERGSDVYAIYNTGLGQATEQHYSGAFYRASKWENGIFSGTMSPFPNRKFTRLHVKYDPSRSLWISVHRDFTDPLGVIVFSSGSTFTEWSQAVAGTNSNYHSSSWAAFLRAGPYIPKPSYGNSYAYPYDSLHIGIDSNNYYHIYGAGTGSISYMRSTDGGTTFGTPHYIYKSNANTSSYAPGPGLYLGRTKSIEFKGKQHVFFNESHEDAPGAGNNNSGRFCLITSSANNVWPTASGFSEPHYRIPDYTSSNTYLPNALGMEKDIDAFVDTQGRLHYSIAAKKDNNTGWIGYNYTDTLGTYPSEHLKRGSHDTRTAYDVQRLALYSPTFVQNNDRKFGECLSLYFYASGSIIKVPLKTKGALRTRLESTIEDNTYPAFSSSKGELKLEKRHNFSTWRQIRKSNPLMNYFKENSIVPITDITTELKSNGRIKEEVTNHHFVEPPLTSKYKPLTHTLSLDEGDTAGAYDLQSAYGTYMEFYNNERINDILQIKGEEEDTFYGKFLKSYLLGESSLLSNTALKFINKILHFSYEEQIFPKKKYTYLKSARDRGHFAEASGLSSAGYDRTYGSQRTFYRDLEKRSSTDALNSMGIDPTDVVEATQTFDFEFTSLSLPSQTLKNADSYLYLDSDLNQYAIKLNGSGTRYFEILTPFAGNINIKFDYLVGNDAVVGGEYYENPDSNETLRIQKKRVGTSTWTDITSSAYLPISHSNNAGYPTAGVWQSRASANTTQLAKRYLLGSDNVQVVPFASHPTDAYTIRFVQINHSNYSYDNYGIKNVQVIGSSKASEKPAAAFWPMRTDGNSSFSEESTYSENIGELMQDTDETIYGAAPVPSLSYVESTNIRKDSISSDYVERLTETISGKKPFVDKYEDFRDDFRGIAKDMSLLPEYTISEHIDNFVGTKSNPVSLVSGYLKVDGVEHSASVGLKTGITENEFFDKYLTTENMEYYSQDNNITEDHKAGGLHYSTLDIDVTAVKKMMIKNGFYPITRTVQLGNLLSSSFQRHVSSFQNDVATTGTAEQKRAIQGLLKPFMSPGIMFNSLKSGLAVDYPIYTSDAPTVIEGGDNTFGDFNMSTAPDFRLPFDSLYIPSKLPANDKIRFISSFVSDTAVALEFPYQFSWDGMFNNPKFELGMHNFLAESVNFFLQQGELTTFKSKTQSEFEDDLDPTKKYYMDVSLSDATQLNKFVEYSGQKRVEPDPFFQDDVLFMDAVSGSDAYYACGMTQRNPVAMIENNKPKDFFGTELLSIWKNYLDDTGWNKVQSIELDKLSTNNFVMTWGRSGPSNTDPFGIIGSGSALRAQPMAKLSYGSSGLHLAIGDPFYWVKNDSNRLGAIHLFKGDEDGFKLNDDGSPKQEYYTLITSSHFSDGGQGSRNHNDGIYGGLCGSGVSLSDDSDGGIYITALQSKHPAFNISSDGPMNGHTIPADFGIVNVFHSKSSGFTVTQGADNTEYNHTVSGSENRINISNVRALGEPLSWTNQSGQIMKLLDTQHVKFINDYDNKASGLHVIAGGPYRGGESPYSYKVGAVDTFHFVDQGAGKAMTLNKHEHFSGSDISRNAGFGTSVAVAADMTGVKKEIYYFASSDAYDKPADLTVPDAHDQVHGRIVVFCSQSVPVPNAYSFDPQVHNISVSASHAFHVTSSQDIDKFIQNVNHNSGYAYHVDGVVRYNKDTAINEVYALATIPQLSASHMSENSYLTGGLAFIALSASNNGATWYQNHSVVPAKGMPSQFQYANVAPRTPAKLVYGGNPNNSSHNLFAFTFVGGYASSTTGDNTALAWPTASSAYGTSTTSYTTKAVLMFTGSVAMPAADGDIRQAVSFANNQISSSLSHHGTFVNKQHGKLFGLGVDAVMDPGYVAYTPPHFYGEAIARISYTPRTSVKPTIREIFQNANVEDILIIEKDRVATHDGRQRKYKSLTATQKEAKMPLASSIDLFGTANDPDEVNFEKDGKKSFKLRRTNTDNSRWIISTKYECPVLDSRPYDSQYSSSYNSHNSSIDDSFGFVSGKVIKKPKTPWSTFGEYNEDALPALSVRDSFAQGAYNQETGSLLSVVGFEAETKRVSKVAESKKVSEAILLVPYIEKRNYTTGQPFLDKNSFSPIKLSKWHMVNSLRYGPSTDGIYRIPEMIEDMQKYHIPPRLDFLKYAKQIKDKFAMFFVEVDHTFDREDLTNIWQGLTPDLAENMAGELFNEKLKVSIKDFFYLHGGKPPSGMKFAIFKVKQKAKKNYFKTTADSKDDKNFLVSFGADSKEKIDEDRSFNWPYDYFSIIEAAKIDTTINMSAEVFTDERTIVVSDEDRSRAIASLLGRTAFNRRKRKRDRKRRSRMIYRSSALPKYTRKPPLDEEAKAAADKIKKMLSKDQETKQKNKYRYLPIPRVSGLDGSALVRKPKLHGKTKKKIGKPNKKTGMSLGLGKKTMAMIRDHSPHKRKMTKRAAKNLKEMVSIIGTKFSWKTRR